MIKNKNRTFATLYCCFIMIKLHYSPPEKSSVEVKSRHTRGLKAFSEDYPKARLICVSLDKYKRKLNGVEIIPAHYFLKELWAGQII